MEEEEGQTNDKSKKCKPSQQAGYRRKRRAPPKAATVKKKNTILIHRKSDFKSQLERCQRLLDKGEEELTIHGLGAAVNRAVNIALQLEIKAKGLIKLKTTTSSVELIDDFEPLAEDLEPHAKSRCCSAIHIVISKTPKMKKGEHS